MSTTMTVLSVWIYKFSIGLVILSLITSFVRMSLGPSLPDRVVALDLSVNMIISFIAIYSITAEQPIYMDVVIALALIIFLGTVAFAQLIERQTYLKKQSLNKMKEDAHHD